MTAPEHAGGEVIRVDFEQHLRGQVEAVTEQAVPGGALRAVAEAALPDESESPVLSLDVYDIIQPWRDAASGPARWELIADAKDAVKHAATEQASRIAATAQAIGQIRREGDEDYSAIDPDKAIVVVQDGANKTSIVRRHVAEKAMSHAGIDGPMYQLGSSQRQIAPRRADQTSNPEHTMLRELAGDFLPEGTFTAFDANLATALQDGYEIENISSTSQLPADLPESVALAVRPRSEFRRAIRLVHADPERPEVVLIAPSDHAFDKGGLNAVRAVWEARTSMEVRSPQTIEGRQFVIATNGQYRPMAELQAYEWSLDHEIPMSPPVAVGDEPGDKTPYNGQEITTAPRSSVLYANELSLFGRRATAHFITYGVTYGSENYNLPGSVRVEEPNGELMQYEPDGSCWLVRGPSGIWYDGPNDAVGHILP